MATPARQDISPKTKPQVKNQSYVWFLYWGFIHSFGYCRKMMNPRLKLGFSSQTASNRAERMSGQEGVGLVRMPIRKTTGFFAP